MPQRLAIILGALAVGAIFLAGLFVHGRLGGALLLLTAAILGAVSGATWGRVRPQGRPLRIAVIAVIVVLGLVKVIHG